MKGKPNNTYICIIFEMVDNSGETFATIKNIYTENINDAKMKLSRMMLTERPYDNRRPIFGLAIPETGTRIIVNYPEAEIICNEDK